MEYDPEHPHVKFERKAMLTHYANLKKHIATPKNFYPGFNLIL
ncbi:MAG: hypothetical protein R2847_10230 [Bacteroidia bacterium]